MNLRPLGDRVLIKPLAQPTTTESGIILAEHKKPDEVGTVVAVGFARHPLKEEAEKIATQLADISLEAQCGGMKPVPGFDGDHAVVFNAQELLLDLVRREPCVKVGDTVLFSWASGQEITLNDGEETYLLMKESDLLAVYDEEQESVTIG